MKQNLENNIRAHQVSQALGKKVLTKGNQSQGSGHSTPCTTHTWAVERVGIYWWSAPVFHTGFQRPSSVFRMTTWTVSLDASPWPRHTNSEKGMPWEWGIKTPDEHRFMLQALCHFSSLGAFLAPRISLFVYLLVGFTNISYYIFSLLFFSSSQSRWAPPAAISAL